MALLALRGQAPQDQSWGFDTRWLYGLNLVLVGGLLAWHWRDYGELARQNWPSLFETLAAVLVGLVVFGLWITLTARWMQIGQATAAFVPLDAQGQLLWPLIAVRWLGATLLVPVMEELFWRSFLMRWFNNPQFERVPPGQTTLKAVVLSTFVFMLAHPLWLAAVVAGLACAGLYRWRGNSFKLSARGNIATGKGSVQAGWFSPPLLGPLRGYVQVFSGYGESLIDYNWNQTTIGAGVALNDGF